MRGNAHVSFLSRHCRAADVARRMAQDSLGASFHDDYGDTEAGDFDAADQAFGGRGRRRCGIPQQGLQPAGFPRLKDAGLDDRKHAVTEQGHGAGKKNAAKRDHGATAI